MKIKLLIPIVVLSLSVAFVSISVRAANNDHEADEKKNPNSSKTPGRKIEPKGNNVTSEECEVRSGDIARFANGEVYNFGAVVSLVAKPSCAVMSNSLVINELSQGINFNRVPFHLDEFSKGFSSLTVEGKKKVELGIDRNLRTQLNAENYSNKELLPVLGQLALLSPKAARSTLAYLITQELIAQELEGKQGLVNGRDVSSAVDTISILKRFGADEPLIVQELSADVEEMASNSQADSLGKVLTGLALAAREVDVFALAFNSSAGAFNRGVRQSNNDYTADERNSLLKAGFSVANASVGYSPSIEPGAQEVNEALKVLLRGAALDETSLKNVWRKVVEVTAASSGQTALAQALALSLTSNVIFLSKGDRDSLLSSAKIHGS
ncbi:MAG: hypothetical protein ACKOA8_09050, partial [Deltaproteobacteria bacterium]